MVPGKELIKPEYKTGFMDQRKAYLVLAAITLTVFTVKAFPVAQASTVPPGWVDTSYHTSTALDVSRGNIDSLMHPWWHVKGNSVTVDGLAVIDRESETFYYPPFLHLFIAAFMLVLPAGLATILSVSLLYSLSVPASYLLARSYRIANRPALLGAGLTGSSLPLLRSQLMGFWSFASAFIFGTLAFSFYRINRERSDRRYLAGYLATGLASALTHWVFGAFVVGLPVLDTLIEGKELDWKIPGTMLALLLPNYLLFFATSSIGNYTATSFNGFYPWIGPVIAVAGLAISWKRYRAVNLLLFGTLAAMTAYYLGVPLPFGGMLQFALPLLAGFQFAAIYRESPERFRQPLAVIAAAAILFGLLAQIPAGRNAGRAITEEQFHELIDARDELPDRIIAGRGIGSWVTLASRDRRILSPFQEYSTSRLDPKKFHVLNP